MRETFGMVPGARTVLEDPTLAEVLIQWEEHAPIVINDVAQDPRVDAAMMHEMGIRSLMLVPIISQDAVVGALVFRQRTERKDFTTEEVDFATRLMSIATLAFENARLYERELRISETLQQAAIAPRDATPGVVYSVAYQPASKAASIGGDFYNVFAIGPDHVGIVIGDVSGKGLKAARLTSLLQDSIRAYAYEDWRPATVMNRVNRLVQHLSPTESYATVFFGVLTPSTGALVFVSGGHPTPIVVSERHVRFLGGQGSPIVGAFEDVEFGQSEATLDQDEMLVLYTDGISEARDSEGVFFNGERLLKSVRRMRHTAVQHMPKRLVGAALRFAGGTLRDDTIVLCVKRSAAEDGLMETAD